MAIKDVKNYYYTMQAQYLEMQADLADFEKALADGFITEEQLASIKEDVAQVKCNYDRLSYIMYLFEVPNRDKKKDAFYRNTAKIKAELSARKADQAAVRAENESVLTHLRNELKNLNK